MRRFALSGLAILAIALAVTTVHAQYFGPPLAGFPPGLGAIAAGGLNAISDVLNALRGGYGGQQIGGQQIGGQIIGGQIVGQQVPGIGIGPQLPGIGPLGTPGLPGFGTFSNDDDANIDSSADTDPTAATTTTSTLSMIPEDEATTHEETMTEGHTEGTMGIEEGDRADGEGAEVTTASITTDGETTLEPVPAESENTHAIGVEAMFIPEEMGETTTATSTFANTMTGETSHMPEEGAIADELMSTGTTTGTTTGDVAMDTASMPETDAEPAPAHDEI